MAWKRTAAPTTLMSCNCGRDAVEEKADGLVRLYRLRAVSPASATS